MSILNLECDTNRKNEEISIDLSEWQVHKAKLEEIRSWLEDIEKKINVDNITQITLQLANEQLKNAQVCSVKKKVYSLLQEFVYINFFYKYIYILYIYYL